MRVPTWCEYSDVNLFYDSSVIGAQAAWLTTLVKDTPHPHPQHSQERLMKEQEAEAETEAGVLFTKNLLTPL